MYVLTDKGAAADYGPGTHRGKAFSIARRFSGKIDGLASAKAEINRQNFPTVNGNSHFSRLLREGLIQIVD